MILEEDDKCIVHDFFLLGITALDSLGSVTYHLKYMLIKLSQLSHKVLTLLIGLHPDHIEQESQRVWNVF
jgi:hypothetical protein